MSNLYKCSNCGHAVGPTARFCTGCRTPGPIARHPNSWRTSEPSEAIVELLAAERDTLKPHSGTSQFSEPPNRSATFALATSKVEMLNSPTV